MSFVFPRSNTRPTRAMYSLVVLLFMAAVVGMSIANAATLSPVVRNVSNDPDVQSLWPESAQGPNGDIHIVWDSAEGGYKIRYVKGVWNGTNYDFGPSQVVGAAHPTGFAQPAVSVAPNGTIMVAWSNQDRVMSYRIWNSADAGPSGNIISLSGGIQPSIAVDSESDFHLAWSGNFDIQYREINPAGAIISTALFGQEVVSPPDIAVDASNNTHVVWHRQGQVVQYAVRAAGTPNFGPIETIGSGTAPQIAADGLGNVHIVRSKDDIIYCRKTFGTACTDSHTIGTSLTDIQPSIGATRAGSFFIAFRAGGSIWYDALEGGSWQSTKEIAGTSQGAQVDVSTRPYTNRVSIVYGQGFDIQHRFATTSPVVVCGVSGANEVVSTSNATTKIYLPLIMRSEKQPSC